MRRADYLTRGPDMASVDGHISAVLQRRRICDVGGLRYSRYPRRKDNDRSFFMDVFNKMEQDLSEAFCV